MNKNKNLTYKVRNIFTLDTFYTNPQWGTKSVDGVEFVAVKKNPDDIKVNFMKRDSLERVK
jgi:hypothetical protein